MTADNSSDGGRDLGGLRTVMPEELGRLPTSLRRLSAGETFANRYVIDVLIGEGGSGSVYSAQDKRTGRSVALKLIRTDRLASPGAREQLVKEAVTTRDIRHPNVVAVYDVDEWDSQPFMTMELLFGQSLRALIKDAAQSDHQMSVEVAAEIMLEILAGLEAAHARGVIHRDLKPENIGLVDNPDPPDSWGVRIIDFGIAYAAGSQAGAAALGTPLYMAPEQLTAPDAVKPSADLYSLSVIFYELLTGMPPQGRYSPVGRGRNDVPAEIEALIDAGLTSNPRGRPQTAKAYRAALEAVLPRLRPRKAADAFHAALSAQPVELRDFRDRMSSGGWGPYIMALPPGRFLMGSPAEDVMREASEIPQREVRIDYQIGIGTLPVTWAEYECAVEAGACAMPEDDEFGRDQRPVTNVTREDAEAYCAWLSRETGETYRLPSEAEWEYACRAGTTTLYSFGDTPAPAAANYDWSDPESGLHRSEEQAGTTIVGAYPQNPFGLCDMHGNVWEWVEDSYRESYTPDMPVDGGRYIEPGSRKYVVRGGSWASDSHGIRSATRGQLIAGFGFPFVGFRVVREM